VNPHKHYNNCQFKVLEEPFDVVHFVCELLFSGWAKRHVVLLENNASNLRVL
jgi:hypothetical protein